ncbi:MAG TPA: hypothetical protein PLW13_14440 [Pseudomonadales bacterium]|nr:hypothetical protein [Pseudomonadales bacterium]
MYRFDPRQFDLSAWARWVASGRPVHFSMLGNSLCGQPFMPQHKRTYRDDSPLWQEHDGEIDEHVARLMRIDSVVHGALSVSERRLLLAAVAPSGTGHPLPLVERARLAGASPEALRAIRRKAMALID